MFQDACHQVWLATIASQPHAWLATTQGWAALLRHRHWLCRVHVHVVSGRSKWKRPSGGCPGSTSPAWATRGAHPQPHLRGGVQRRHGPHGSGAGGVEPCRGRFCRPAEVVLGMPRPQGMGQGNDRGTQYRSGIHLSGADAHGGGQPCGLSTTPQRRRPWGDHHGNPLRAAVFPGGGLPPAVSGQARQPPLLLRHAHHSGVGGFSRCRLQAAPQVWSHYDWSISHCVLRGDNTPIAL